MILRTLELNDIDIEAFADLTYTARQNSPLHRDDQTIDGLKKYFERACTAWNDTIIQAAFDDTSEELLGWMAVWLGWSSMGVIHEWQPIVHPRRNPENIAISLLEYSKKLMKTHSRSKIEIWPALRNKEVEEISSTYFSWYEKCGFYRIASEYHMQALLSMLSSENPIIPEGIEVIPLSDVDNDDIRNLVLDTFYESQDEWFSTQTKSEQEGTFDGWLKRNDSFDNNASVVFKKDGAYIAYNVVRVEDGEVEIGPIGVQSKYRGRGLGKALLLTSFARLRNRDIQNVHIEVSTKNEIAAYLYAKVGFKKQYSIVMYSWSPR